MKPTCLLGFHVYSEWSELVPTYDGVQQYRYCKHCNKIVRRDAMMNIEANLQMWNHKKEESK